jgi:hypothetical protein
MELNPLIYPSAAPAVMPAIPAAPSSSDVAAFNNLMNPTTAQTPMSQTARIMAESEDLEQEKYNAKQPIEEKEVRVKEEVKEQVKEEVKEVQHVEKHDEVKKELQTAAKISNA